MGGLWIFLSGDWKLQDVQAGINVVVSLLSGLLILVIARVSWQRSARKVTQNKPTRISSLLDISSPGDVLDIFWFLRHRILQKRYIIALLQCILVIFLTATATFSGPIARYSTRTAQQVTAVKTEGSLAVADKQTTLYDTATIQAAYNSLRQANFPTNQMLDFLPDTSVPWVYEPNEWNSTWAAVCEYTPKTAISLNATGNYSLYKTDPDSPLDLLNEVQPLQDIWPLHFRYGHNPVGIDGEVSLSFANYWPESFAYQDELLFMANFLYSNASDAAWTVVFPLDTWVNISIAVVYMHGGPIPTGLVDGVVGSFGKGLIPESYYTRVDCNMSRVRGSVDGTYQSYPNTRSVGDLGLAYTEQFTKDFFVQSNAGKPVTLPDGRDIFRLFQSWTIVKDSEYSHAQAARDISVRVQTVQISTVFLVIASLTALVVIIGGLWYFVFVLKHYSDVEATPQSKIDWMMQAVDEAEVAKYLQHNPIHTPLDSEHHQGRSRVTAFNTAMYGPASEDSVHGSFPHLQSRIIPGSPQVTMSHLYADEESAEKPRAPISSISKPPVQANISETSEFRNELTGATSIPPSEAYGLGTKD